MSGRHQTSVKKKHHGRDDIKAGWGARAGRGVTGVGTRRAVEADPKEGLVTPLMSFTYTGTFP